MILDRELDVPSARRDVPPCGQQEGAPEKLSTRALIFALLFALVLVLQTASGAYHCEFSGYPDESAHYVTSLMVRQYITSPHPGSPVAFAREYYSHYPKVAFGHWPPLLYIVQALWMSVFSPARFSVLLELAFTTTLLAYSVYSQARIWLADVPGRSRLAASILAGVITVCIPLMQTYTDEEMSETLLALTCFWSAIFFVRYLDSHRWQDNCLFGVFFALAVLTKGSGWLLTLLPPLALLLTRKLRLLLRPSFWLAAVIVGATCIPWQLMTMRLVEEGWEGGTRPSVKYTLDALLGFAVLLNQIMGPALLLFAALGVAVTVLLVTFKRSVPACPAVMFSLFLADWLFHSLVPAGVEDRKLIVALPALVLFFLAGAFWLADRLPVPPSFRAWRLPAVGLIVGVFFCARTFAIPQERHLGYIEAARFIASDSALRKATILVSSASGGEGPFIAEVAMRQPHPAGVILRATKVLAHVSFDADVYRQLFPDAQSVLKFLRQRHVDLIVLDTFAPSVNFPHDLFLHQLASQPGPFVLAAAFPTSSSHAAGQVQLYRLRP